jgi:predicted XRE-type DNA-binding protein
MRLAECLNSSDIDTLRKIAEAYNFDCQKSSKNSLMKEIIAHFKDRCFIQQSIAGIKETAMREAVSHLMLDNRQEFSREEVLATVRRAGVESEGDDLKWMDRLLQEGWLFRLNAHGGRQLYFVPEDMRKTIRTCLSEFLKQRVQLATEPPIIYRDEGFALVRDAAVFLQYLSKHEVRITKDGTIPKRQQQQLFALFEIKEEPLGKVAWRFGFGRRFHDYPDRFALLYDYCYNRELIVESPGGELLLHSKAQEWLSREEKERAEDLFRFWRLLYRRPIPKLKLCIATLSQTAKEDWVLVESMNVLLAPYVNDYYYEKAHTVMEQRIYGMLVHQGLLAYGQLADGTAVIKLTALGRELLLAEKGELEETAPSEEKAVPSMPWILQPNFDLLVPIETLPHIEAKLDELSELIRVDTMRIYRLTKASVCRAFGLGWTGQAILEFLRGQTGDMVPGNVERMIEQWAAEFTRVRLFRAVVVECPDEGVATALKGQPDVAPHLRMSLTATHFLIDEGGMEAVQSALQNLGLDSEAIG